jgi:hypothetical protein
MKAISRRIDRLENQIGPADGRAFLVVITGVGLALDADHCVEILKGHGFVAASGFVVIDLLKTPRGLSAKETETYLRKNGAVLCSPPPDTSCR